MKEVPKKNYEAILDGILNSLKRYCKHADGALLRKAFNFAFEAHRHQLRRSGQPYIVHCLEVARILTEMEMDDVTITAGLLHDVAEDTGVTLEEVKAEFGEEVALLVDGVTKISELHFNSLEEKQAETFRKMIFSMIRDIRVILIKFADRLHNMRTIQYLPQKKQQRIALETREIYAPLAHRLGIAKIKWELEDLAFKVLNPHQYDELVNKVNERRDEREAYLQRIRKPILQELRKVNIKAEVTGRPKHLYSIYRKMVMREKPFEEIYDLFAVRIIVKRVEECYSVLGIVHTLFTPIHERFKDYIAIPKSNMYQSIHTTVIGPEGRMVEIQIRTEEMHRTAESGIAAHWRYKEGKQKVDELDEQLVWLRHVLDWQRDVHDAKEFMEDLKISLFQDEIFVFTPKGDLIKLPRGATPVDFAFAVHTDIGYHCIGAKANGKIIPLDTQLQSGDSVEIITSAKQVPNPDWIQFVKTSKARSRIKKWIRDSLFEESIKLGREILEKRLKKLHYKASDEEIIDVAQGMGFPNEKQFLAAIGRGEISVQGVLAKLLPESAKEAKKDDSFFHRFVARARKSATGVKIHGLDDLLIHFAKCCHPVPGDRIVGFITRGKGVVVHRADCSNLVKLMEDPDRQIEVKWDVNKDNQFLVGLRLIAEDRKGLLRDISEAIAATDTNIVNIEMKVENSVVVGSLIVQVKNLQHLTRIINKIDNIKNVISVERLNGLRGQQEQGKTTMAL
ncbi:hypothetical protein DRQ15_03320 [candidate division KSB1 bacterium]|nr:MAG: hypothetical protein DRQ12_04240 [candidate division KSB1 bacterium]RKY84876.1 MAG: hypothetical protein DRP98_04015 [candidate division KSB1 bacterium]RKY87575.1 MAG: hypothetical protein DRQ11_05885 [candidate division KSB1 bacterium]RKY92069.1 MAG: hypothetical protein DRQ15_03320 [candidate division KSB1 bacterium]